jgi:hypothetical protein
MANVVETLNADFAKIERALTSVGASVSFSPNRVPVTFDTSRRVNVLSFGVSYPQDRVSGLHMLDVEIADAGNGAAFNVSWKDWRGDHNKYTTRYLTDSDVVNIVAAYEDARGAFHARKRETGATRPSTRKATGPFPGYTQHIAKTVQSGVARLHLPSRTGADLDSVPMINDDTLRQEADTLIATVPKHMEDAIRAYVAESARAYTAALLQGAGAIADGLTHRLELHGTVTTKIEAAAEAQNLDAFVTRAYSRGASYISSADNAGFDAAQRVALMGRKFAARAYATDKHDDVLRELVERGRFAEAVLGTMQAFRIQTAMERGDFTVTHFGGINQYTSVTLNPSPLDEPFAPPILVGWTYPGIVSGPDGALRAVARMTTFAVLLSPQLTGVMRNPPKSDDRVLQRVRDGVFSMEDDTQGRTLGFPATLLKTAFGQYGAGVALPAVPVGNYVIRHVKKSDLTLYQMNEYARMLVEKHGYRWVDSKTTRSEVTRGIARTKNDDIKWISPDPFAKG